jgi:MFS family permease
MAVLRLREFRLLWAAELVSVLGDNLLFVVLPFYVYRLSGSAMLSAVTFAAEVLPTVLLRPFAGVLADAYDRRRIMIACDLVRMCATLSMAFVTTARDLPLLYAAALVNATAAQLFIPAQAASVPGTVPRASLVAANAALSVNDSVAKLTGPALGTLLLTYVGFGAVVAADAGTFLLSALLLSRLRLVRPESAGASRSTGWARAAWADLQSALLLVRGSPTLRSLFLLAALVGFGGGAINAVMVPFARDILGGGPAHGAGGAALGVVFTAQGAGALLAGVVAHRLARALGPRRLLAFSFLIAGPAALGLLLAPSLLLAAIASAGLGAPAALGGISLQALMAGSTPDAFLGRVFGAWGSLGGVFTLLGLGVAGASVDLLGVRIVFAAAAVLFGAAGFAALGVPRDAAGAEPAPRAAAAAIEADPLSLPH